MRLFWLSGSFSGVKWENVPLQEAFTSSERMVHLISDFLNVSRLQTGKFVIDRVQTDLVSLVAEEVANVSQVASAHKVNVRFRKPARFPLLYLDENKLRQVIMNLIDNAIYYSPNADTVRVRLSIEDGDVVLRVVDHGMGVPKDAQKRLFTKFFRAENARRQRPDGTGIGLYLAKKVGPMPQWDSAAPARPRGAGPGRPAARGSP